MGIARSYIVGSGCADFLHAVFQRVQVVIVALFHALLTVIVFLDCR